MEYTKIPEDFVKEYNRLCKVNQSIKIGDMKNPTWQSCFLWAMYQLGIRIRVYQAYCIHKFLTSKDQKVILCWARQLGKSVSLGVFCLWATWFNIFPATIEKITTAFIMSRDDDTAKELLGKIRGLLTKGDAWMKKVLKDKADFTDHYFTGRIIPPDNEHQITFQNRCFIKSVPPTDTVLGKSASIFCQDEDAKLKITPPLDDYKLHYEVVKPTMAETNGIWIRSSTPNGESGDFFETFDPFDRREKHDFERLWFGYDIYDNPEWLARMKSEEGLAKEKGPMAHKLWQQEHMALFTVSVDGFFEPEDVDKGKDDSSYLYEFHDGECSLSIDYGIKISRTVITIRSVINGKCVQINQIRFPPNFDINNLIDENYNDSIPNLMKRYNVAYVVPDNCAQGDMINRWMKNKGYNIVSNNADGLGFNFRSDQSQDRNRGYYQYRARVKSGFIKYPSSNTTQIGEMKLLQETKLKVNVSIKSPEGELCDCVDSDFMAAYPFIQEQSSFQSQVVDYAKLRSEILTERGESDPRRDKQWEKYQTR